MEKHENPIIKGTTHIQWLYDDVYKCPLCGCWFKSEKEPIKCVACNYTVKLNLTERILRRRR